MLQILIDKKNYPIFSFKLIWSGSLFSYKTDFGFKNCGSKETR